MIDVSKYEKVGEFKDGRLHWLEGRDINAVYLIKFKEDFYIGSAEYLYIRIKEHTKSFLKGEHVDKMQSVFDRENEFEVYVIEKGIDEATLLIEETKYIKQFSPTLNTICAANGKNKLRDILEMKIALAGLTKKEVAAKLTNNRGTIGISQPSMSSLINGNPSYSRLKEIADILGITVSELVADDTEEMVVTVPKDVKTIKIKIEQSFSFDDADSYCNDTDSYCDDTDNYCDAPASHIESQMHCPYCGHDLKIDLK